MFHLFPRTLFCEIKQKLIANGIIIASNMNMNQ